MPTALYYPHTRLENEGLLKTALVLFDKVRWIAPDHEYVPPYENALSQAAMDLIGERHVPTDGEKQMAHQEVEHLVSQPLPEQFVFQPKAPGYNPYQILPGKFLQETWDLLQRESRFVDLSGAPATGYKQGAVYDYQTSPALGLTLMGILAYVCAGKSMLGITDLGDQYKASMNYLTTSIGFVHPEPERRQPNLDEFESLINISFKTINCDDLPIERLIALRTTEQIEGDGVLRNAREEYFKLLKPYAGRLITDVRTLSDKETIENEFIEETERKLIRLKKELGVEKRKTLLSKEVLGAAVIVLGAAALHFFPSGIDPETAKSLGLGLIGFSGVDAGLLAGKVFDHYDRRKDKLKTNPMGWLYF
jgi:hypothetical protein